MREPSRGEDAPAAAGGVTGEASLNGGGRTRILVVDDSVELLKFLRLSLEMMTPQPEVMQAISGREALDLAQERVPDLILLDIMMPEMSGYEVFDALKQDPRTAEVPVIFVTARTEIADRVQGLEAGAADYLCKPVHPEELQARVRAALRVKEREKSLRELAEQSIVDPLTGVYNRRYLDTRLGEEVARARRYGDQLGCLMVDLDHFKPINDTFGHQVGDEALKSLSRMIQGCTRRTDIFARYGGEEFTVVLPQTPPSGIRIVAEKIRSAIELEPVRVEGATLRMTVSLGASLLLPSDEPPDLIARADQALYQAKESGRNRVVVAPELRDSLNL